VARYLVISSQVAHGHVGLSAIVPALNALGHEVIALPTVLLSNHPGHVKVAGQRIEPDVLGQMVDALDANGRLDEIDAILTGYLPTVEHVRFAAETVRKLWAGMPNNTGSYFCDPVLGDDPKGLYIATAVAHAIKDLLLPLAHTVSPNRFELEWLSGRPVTHLAGAIDAARALGPDKFICPTSIPSGLDDLLTLETFVAADGTFSGKACRVKRRDCVPHGTGDLLSGLLLTPLSLGQAVGSVDAAIEASRGCDELQLIASAAQWLEAAPVAEEPIEALL
jgi:pyridoxine kinase